MRARQAILPVVLGESWASLKNPEPEKQSEQVYRFLTPVCEVRMSVQYFAGSSTQQFSSWR